MDYGRSVLHNINLDDSTSSSDAADVLIRSTKVVPEQYRKKAVGEGEVPSNCNVNIFVRRLSDSAHSSCLEETFTNGLMDPIVPPVLPANMPSALIRGFAEEDHTAPDPPARKNHVPEVGQIMLKAPVIQRKIREQKEQDVHISRYNADGRGAVAAALKQRSHSAPLRREVKVQFLDSGTLQSSDLRGPEVQPSSAFPSGDAGGASAVAAITAAAIAATAPLIKAQSDMEARMAQVASELRRLQESEGQTDRAPESRAANDADRVTQLEVQLTALTQQRLQHLERIQGQQLELQNRLLGSALNAVTARTIQPSQSTCHTDSGVTLSELVQRADFSTFNSQSHRFAGEDGSTVVQEQSRETRTGREKSPLETPAPRKVIPRPTHWNPALQDSQQGSSKPRKATHKTHGNGRLLEQIPNNQRSPTRCPAHSVGVRRVAIATVDSQPEQSRENQPEVFIFSTGRPRPEESAEALTKPSSKQDIQAGLKDVTPLTFEAPNSSSSALQQATTMLQDLSRIKNEMRSMLRTADAFPVESAKASRSSKSSRPALPSPPPPPPVPPVSMQGNAVTSGAARTQPMVPQNSQPPASMFEDAGRVLRQVRHSRKVLEENLQAVLRAKDGEALHTQLEALSNNRDASEELRIKKTVDAWINTLSKEIQNELVHPDSAAQSKGVERSSRAAAASVVQRDQSSRIRNTTGPRKGSVKIGREGKGATAAAAAAVARRKQQSREESASAQPSSQHLSSSLRSRAEEHPQPSLVLQSEDDEAYLAKIYGKALYEGHRRTLKKGPYLRFSSPIPKSKGQRPKVIESVKGVKMKSSKTQTSMSRAQDSSSLLQPAVSEPQYLFSPSGPVQQQQPGNSVPGFLIPMAIPLGKPKVDGQAPLPSRVIISDKPATVITSFLPTATPKVAPSVRKPNTVLLEVHSEQKPTPQLQIQVQPSVNIESVTAQSPDLSPPLHIPPPDIQAGADARVIGEEDEEDDDGFPGTKFLAVADIQEPEVDGEAPGEAPIELNGLPSPPAALYHGPAFPLEPRQTGPLTEPILSTIQQRETLENRLVDWVEQQLMARMISGMFPQTAQTDPANQSEPDDSMTSDIVETAGGGGLQLFVDAGVPVDSELIRQYVNEVLAEIITLMLGQREGPREPAAPDSIQGIHTRQTTPVPTPVPTPEPSVKEGPRVLRDTLSPVSTPDLSEQPSPVQSPRDSQPVEPQTTLPEPEKTPVVTPASTPLSSPQRIATPSPPPELAGLHNHPWGGAELPLKEEEPHREENEMQPPPL